MAFVGFLYGSICFLYGLIWSHNVLSDSPRLHLGFIWFTWAEVIQVLYRVVYTPWLGSVGFGIQDVHFSAYGSLLAARNSLGARGLTV